MTPSSKSMIQHFDIDANVVFRLGEELITDEIQALMELVKNSYDAEAKRVFVTVSTLSEPASGSALDSVGGYISVEDDGTGMSFEEIRNGWLCIANSYKRKLKTSGKTGQGRTPLGDKGLGRLGVQRLGEFVEIITRSASSPKEELVVSFDWGAFRKAERLSEVAVNIVTRPWTKKRPGTKIIISNLKNIERWDNKKSLLNLQNDLASMVTPYTEIKDFKLYVSVNDVAIDLAEIAAIIRGSAEVKYQLSYKSGRLFVSGKARLNHFRPSTKERVGLFEEFCVLDHGVELFNFLKDRGSSRRPPHFKYDTENGWYVDFSREFLLTNVPELKKDMLGQPFDPGDFFGEVDVVPLDSDRNTNLDRASEYKQIAKKLAGIRLYRDGFGIKMAVTDWLMLGRAQTSGPSWYGLKPNGVLGFIQLSADSNRNLTETTSREGLVAGGYYHNFFALLMEFVRFANNTQTFFRRGAIEFLDEKVEQNAGVEVDDPVEVVGEKLDQARIELERQKEVLAAQREKLSKEAKRRKRKRAGGSEDKDDEAIGSCLAEVVSSLTAVEQALGQINDQQALKDVLVARAKALQDEISSMYEFVSLGITAEVIAHEVDHIADDLASRATTISRHLNSNENSDSRSIDFVDHVKSAAGALRKELTFLAPSLRYLRDTKDEFDAESFLESLRDHYKPRLSRRKIQVELKIINNFNIRMNKGKLNQVLENLLLNSEYWLTEARQQKAISKGLICIEVDKPFFRIFDNGKGIDPAVEESLLEPFVTTKPPRDGRGIGLYVVQQLLDSDGCQFYLMRKRNTFGRRYCFQADLSGVLYG